MDPAETDDRILLQFNSTTAVLHASLVIELLAHDEPELFLWIGIHLRHFDGALVE